MQRKVFILHNVKHFKKHALSQAKKGLCGCSGLDEEMGMIGQYIKELKEAGFEKEDIREIIMSTVRLDISPIAQIRNAEELRETLVRVSTLSGFSRS